MPGRIWTPDDDAALELAVRAFGCYDLERLAERVKRSEHGVRQRMKAGPKHLREAVRRAAEAHRLAQTQQEPEPVVAAGTLAPVAIEPDHPTLLRSERKALELEAENRGLKAKVKALQKESGLFEQVAAVVREVVQPLPAVSIRQNVDAVRRTKDAAAPAETAGDRTPCDGILVLSDEHSDEVVSREASWGIEYFDFNIFRCRLERLRDLVRDYATIHLPRHAFERLWIFKLGDSIQGDIHQATAKNHFASSMKAALACGDAEAQFVQSLIPHFPLGVHVVGVGGNHGRLDTKIKKDFGGAHENWDYLVGVQMASRLQGEIEAGRCSVTLPNAWSAYVQVRNTLWALNHGDTVTSYTGLPFVGFDRRNGRVQTLLASVDRRADAFVAGHYHIPASFPSHGAVSFHSGCWTAAEPYALNALAAGGEPQQHFIVVGDKPRIRGILLPVPIYTRHEEREASFLAGEWQPSLGRATVLDLVHPSAIDGLHIVEVP